MKRLLLLGFLFAMITSVVVSCQKELSYETDQNTGHGTLYDSANACQPMVPNGTYYNGVLASRDTNYVKVIVTVTQMGTYELNTGLVNGFGFTDTGYFSKLGVDTILLHAYGTPSFNVPTDFTLTLDSSTCGFTINVQDSTGTGLGGGIGGGVIPGDSSFTDPNPAATNTWHFTDSTSGATYSGVFDITNLNNLQGGFVSNDTLYVVGQASTADTLFGLSLVLPNATIQPGIYPVNAGNVTGLQAVTDPNNPVTVYGANDETATAGTPLGNSYITITSYSNNQLAGSIHTYAQRSDGILVLIAGSFNCTVH